LPSKGDIKRGALGPKKKKKGLPNAAVAKENNFVMGGVRHPSWRNLRVADLSYRLIDRREKKKKRRVTFEYFTP
jgi:hypothetical protein